MEKPTCRICGTTESLLRCIKCKSAYYCCTNHQRTDWPNHKKQCQSFANARMAKEILLQQQFGVMPSEAALQLPNTSTMDLGMSAEQLAMEIESTTGNGGLIQQTEPILYDPRMVSDDEMSRRNEAGRNFQINQGSFIQPALAANSNDQRYDELCKTIIYDMNTYGLSVVDDFLGRARGLQILNEVHRLYASGVFKDGLVVSNKVGDKNIRGIRSDKTHWVKGVEYECLNIGYLINQIDAVVCRANTMSGNGELGKYNIRERTKAMVACYPGSGSHYITHVDNPERDGRVITAIYYLNINWDTKRSGGILRIFPEKAQTQGSVADIEPKFDRLIFFWSDKRNPHEVQPAHRTRYAITVWYFDAAEREEALNRTKYRSVKTNNCT